MQKSAKILLLTGILRAVTRNLRTTVVQFIRFPILNTEFPFNITNSKRSSSSSTESVMQFNKIRQNNISGSVENRDYFESYLNQKAVRSCTLRYSC